MKKLLLMTAMLMATTVWSAEKDQPGSADQAMQVLDSFMLTFNSRDM